MLPPIANKTIIQQNPPPAFDRQNLLPTTAQSQTQPSGVANQDLHPANVNAMTGASLPQMQSNDIQGSHLSDRSPDIDLPPEFAALFHVSYSFTFHLFSMRRAAQISRG
jgi:hypothetical protein